MMKEREIKLLEAISEDELVTQANLSSRLGIAVGSVNWYIKRLISRGYLKATRMDRTRLRYNMTAEGLAVLRRRASQYMKDSLKVYQQLRVEAKAFIADLQAQGIKAIYLAEDDEAADIFRLSCIEAKLHIETEPTEWEVKHTGTGYRLIRDASPNGATQAT
jgi:DNA-binding IclR family transcriptional regulator